MENRKEKFNIILIDDSAEDLELAIRALRKNTFVEKIDCFKDGAKGLNFLSGKSPAEISMQLVLLDMNMPVMGGLEFIRKIKMNEKTKNIPIAVLTSTTELPDIKESIRMGVKYYIPKPIESEDIDDIALKLGFEIVGNDKKSNS